MNKITSLETLTDLLSLAGHSYFKELDNVEQTSYGFHDSNMYGITFGAAEADMSNYFDHVKKHRLNRKGVIIGEVMCGTAFETDILKRQFKQPTYLCMDLDESFEKDVSKIGAKFYKQDITKVPSHANMLSFYHGRLDLLFVGNSNLSLCTLTTLQQLEGFADFSKYMVKRGGHVIISAFEDCHFGDVDDLHIDVSSIQLKYDNRKQYKNKWVHWGMVTHRQPATQLHTYFSVAIISTSKNPEDTKSYRAVNYCLDGGTYRSWQFTTIKEMFELWGFQYKKRALEDTATSFMAFQKIK